MTTVPALYTLSEASSALLRGRVSRRTLAEEIRAGRLAASYLGGRYLVTESAVAAMIEARKVHPGGGTCRDPGSQHGSGSGNRETAAPRAGSSSTADGSIRQAAALQSLSALKRPSRHTSRAATVHPIAARSRPSTSRT